MNEIASNLLWCQLLKMTDWEERQKREDGTEKVRWPRRDITHCTRLQESFYKGLFLQRLHPWAVVTNGSQPEEWHRSCWHQDSIYCIYMYIKLNAVVWHVSNSHAVVDYQGGREAHDVRDGHEGDELRQVHKQFWGHSGELVDESSSHCFHGLQLFLRGLTEKTKEQPDVFSICPSLTMHGPWHRLK